MNIGIVNDLRIARESLRSIIDGAPDLEVAWVAEDGQQAVELCDRNPPDLILMDLIMPVMDGVEATRRISQSHACPILIVTASVGANSSQVYASMNHGAIDAAVTPPMEGVGREAAVQSLLAKIDSIGQLIGKGRARGGAVPTAGEPRGREGRFPRILAIGSSNGGPHALAHVLGKLDHDLPAAVVVVQHIDESYADGLVKCLDGQTRLQVGAAEEGAYPEAGAVHVAVRNKNLILDGSGQFHYSLRPAATAYSPSVDVFYRSLLPLRHEDVVAVLLTGMGDDGAQGMLELRQAGCHTIAQDEATSVSYGMPRRAAELNAAVEILPLQQIPYTLNWYYSSSKFHSRR